ncbi:hypothetical protein GE061_009850 [Apolygus lucorum]|uniref:Uncharacterized protein n=1 Tax=Apolygus lucorum TaxID=248454 RepID=A0A6A4JYE1_APOLU|nr:hypothetical protein GE061_009850 [Apolygus lucorum]
MSPVLSFRGKVVLITGAGSVIGAQIARDFSKLGASLVLTDTDKTQLNKVNEECGGNCLLIAAELTKNEDVSSVFEQTLDKFKKLDVLVNYSGTGEKCLEEVSSLDYYDLTMNVNVRLVHHVTMLAVPHLIETKGSIVNVSGLSAGCQLSHVLSNRVSRCALEQLTKCAALQLAPKGVRVNAVSPEMIDTTLNARDSKKNGSKKECGRSGTPKDVADAVVFLASDRAEFISGANLPVDGGRHLTCNFRDINRNEKLQGSIQACSEMVQSPKQNAGLKKEIHKEEPVQKQESKGATVQKHDSKEKYAKRQELKEEPSKPTSTKQPTIITMNHDKPVQKNGDSSQQTKHGDLVGK